MNLKAVDEARDRVVKAERGLASLEDLAEEARLVALKADGAVDAVAVGPQEGATKALDGALAEQQRARARSGALAAARDRVRGELIAARAAHESVVKVASLEEFRRILKTDYIELRETTKQRAAAIMAEQIMPEIEKFRALQARLQVLGVRCGETYSGFPETVPTSWVKLWLWPELEKLGVNEFEASRALYEAADAVANAELAIPSARA